MPFGLQAWNDSGQLIFDTNTRTTRLAGVYTVTSNGMGVINFTPTTGKTMFLFTLQAGNVEVCNVYVASPNVIEWQTNGMQPGSQVNIFYGER